MAEPVVKWAGGKRRLLPELRARLPKTFGRYYEPFAGGAALFFDLEPERAVLGDANTDLIAMYKALAQDVDGVIDLLPHLVADHGKDRYYELRSTWNSDEFFSDETAAAAVFLYLNRACFNGLWRENRAGKMNSPWGKRASVAFDIDNLRAASRALQRADLRPGHFRSTVHDAQRGDLCYFDPPYVPLTKTANFTAYAADGFGPDDQRDLADLARELTERGVHVVLSNSDTPMVRELYSWARIDTVQCDRRVAASAEKRGKVSEVIVVGEARPTARTRSSRTPQRQAGQHQLALNLNAPGVL